MPFFTTLRQRRISRGRPRTLSALTKNFINRERPQQKLGAFTKMYYARPWLSLCIIRMENLAERLK